MKPRSSRLLASPVTNTSLIAVGAYVGWVCIAQFGLPLAPTFVIVIAACAVVGLLIERFALRSLQGTATIAPLLATIGVSPGLAIP
jgi:branched-chain amino acid transport system permease protein